MKRSCVLSNLSNITMAKSQSLKACQKSLKSKLNLAIFIKLIIRFAEPSTWMSIASILRSSKYSQRYQIYHQAVIFLMKRKYKDSLDSFAMLE